MVRITIYAIGKIKEASQRDAGAVYTKRISSFCPIECIEYPEASIQDGNASSLFLAMQKEGQLLCNRISGDDFVIALDRMGKQISSETFSHLIGDCEINGPYQICFLIGGPHGLSDACKKRADYLLSLSTLTFPHQLVRLMLYEQVYRAFTILRGLPYHR